MLFLPFLVLSLLLSCFFPCNFHTTIFSISFVCLYFASSTPLLLVSALKFRVSVVPSFPLAILTLPLSCSFFIFTPQSFIFRLSLLRLINSPSVTVWLMSLEFPWQCCSFPSQLPSVLSGYSECVNCGHVTSYMRLSTLAHSCAVRLSEAPKLILSCRRSYKPIVSSY